MARQKILLELQFSQAATPEKEAYFAREKHPSVIWILNDQSTGKCSMEEF